MIKIENFKNEIAVLVKYVRTPPEELLGEKVDFGLLCLYKGFYYLLCLETKSLAACGQSICQLYSHSSSSFERRWL